MYRFQVCQCDGQIVRVQSLLRRGIGVHHAGLLPIVKEVVEMLFCRGVIKVQVQSLTLLLGLRKFLSAGFALIIFFICCRSCFQQRHLLWVSMPLQER